jgi:hypothetical protein
MPNREYMVHWRRPGKAWRRKIYQTEKRARDFFNVLVGDPSLCWYPERAIDDSEFCGECPACHGDLEPTQVQILSREVGEWEPVEDAR